MEISKLINEYLKSFKKNFLYNNYNVDLEKHNFKKVIQEKKFTEKNINEFFNDVLNLNANGKENIQNNLLEILNSDGNLNMYYKFLV